MAGELEKRHEILVPLTGELVDASDPHSLAVALDSLRSIEAQIRDAKAALTEAIVGVASERGTGTLNLDDGTVLRISAGRAIEYDAERLEDELREAGMPEDSLSEIVEVVVSRKVNAARAKRAAGRNETYREIIERNSREVPKAAYVTISGRPSRSQSPA